MYQTPWSRDIVPGTRFTIPSKVQANESFTVEELVKKFASGSSLGIQNAPIYAAESHDQEDLMKVANMDLFEREQYSVQVAETKRLTEEAIKNQEAENQKKIKEKRENDLKDLALQLREIGGSVEPKA